MLIRRGDRMGPSFGAGLRDRLGATASRGVLRGRAPALTIEPLEPRFLLSAEALLPPPDPQEGETSAYVTVTDALKAAETSAEASAPGIENLMAQGGQSAGRRSDVNTVIFVDGAVENREALVKGVLGQSQAGGAGVRAEVVVLDPAADGVEQVASWLRQFADLSAIHILSHGDSGVVRLGTSVLSGETLDLRADALAVWGDALAADGDLLFYGCDVGAGAAGRAFLDRVAALTGADVAASDDATGTAARGGDWTLEVSVGAIAADPFTLAPDAWAGLLANHISTSADETLTGGADADTFVFTDDWGTDVAIGGGGHDVLDFSGVQGDLVVTVDGTTITVTYADSARAGSLTFTGEVGQTVDVKTGTGADRISLRDDSLIGAISGGGGADSVSFDNAAQPVGVTRNGADTDVVSGAQSYTVTGVEALRGHLSLGASAKAAIDGTIGKWTEIAKAFAQTEILSQTLPILEMSLAEILGAAFADNALDSGIDAARDFVAGLFDLDAAASDVAAATDLGALVDALGRQLDAATRDGTFSLTAGIYNDWSELRLDLSFDALETFTHGIGLPDALSQALADAGFTLDSDAALDVSTRLGGMVSLGLDLSGLSALDGGDFGALGFLSVSPLTVGANIIARGVSATVGLEPAVFGTAGSVGVSDGTLTLDARTQVDYAPDTIREDGTIAASDVDAGAISDSWQVSADGQLDMRLPLTASLGGLDLSNFGTPLLTVTGDDLFVLDGGVWTTRTPDVSLDLRITTEVRDTILDLLGTLDDAGNAALDTSLFNAKIPGLDRSVNEILGFDSDSGDGATISAFGLRQAASDFFDQFDFAVAPPTLTGLAQALRAEVAKSFGLSFDGTRTDWSSARLAGTVFTDAGDVRNFNFSFADLSGADFRGVDLTGVNFTGANLSGALFDAGTILRGARLDGADLTGIDWSDVDLRAVDARNARLVGADLSGKDLSGANLRGADLRGATLADANLRNAILTRADLTGASLTKALALGADFTGVLHGTYDGRDTALSGMVTEQSLLSAFGTSLAGQTTRLLRGASLADYTWDGFDLSGLDFSDMSLSDLSLRGANLRGVDFTGATLSGIDLTGAFAWGVTWPTVDASAALTFDATTLFDGAGVPAWLSSMAEFTLPDSFDFSTMSFAGWDLSGVDFSGWSLDFGGVDFRWARLEGVSFGLPTFSADTDFSYSLWSGVTFSPSFSLNGVFRGVDFTGFDFSSLDAGPWGFDLSGLPDFSGIRLPNVPSVGTFLSSLYAKMKGLDGSFAVKLDFSFADFSGLDLSSLSLAEADLKALFQIGRWRGASFEGLKLPSLSVGAFDFSGLDLSLSDLRFSRPSSGGPSFDFSGANLRGVDLSGMFDAIGDAAGAVYDALSRLSLGDGSLPSLGDLTLKGLDEVALQAVFDTPVEGPAFAVLPTFDLVSDEVSLGFRVLVNLDHEMSTDFSFGLDDLPGGATGQMDGFSVSGTAMGRLVTAIDIAAGIAIATRQADAPLVGQLPVPDAADLYLKLDRMDAGLAAGIHSLSASLVTPIATATVSDSAFTVHAAASLSLDDPDNSDGRGRITLRDIQALDGQGRSLADLVKIAPAVEIDGSFVFDAAAMGISVSDWGSPILTIGSSIIDGVLTPSYAFDVSIDNANIRDNLSDLFEKIGEVTGSLDDSSLLSGALPFVGTSLGDIMQSDDGRTLGDVIAFRTPEGRTVLDDYYAKDGTHTYSGLIQELRDYLGATGDYAYLSSLFPNQYGEAQDGPFTVGGGLLFNAAETQFVKVTDATAGHFTLTYGGNTTGAIAYDADASAVQAALEALSGLNGNIAVTGSAGYYLITFTNALAGTNANRMTADGSGLAAPSGRTPGVSVRTQTEGGSKELRLDLGLNLDKTVSLPFDLGDVADEIGLALTGAGTIDLNALLGIDLSFGLNFDSLDDLASSAADDIFVQVRDISAQVGASLENFNAGVSIGILSGTVDNGTVRFQADASIGLNPDGDTARNGERVTLQDMQNAASLGSLIDVEAMVFAIADLPIKADLMGGDLSKLTGGEDPRISIAWGSEEAPLSLDAIATASPTVEYENFSNLASLSNMTPAQLVQLLTNVGDFLDQFRDSEIFNIPVPFTGIDLGDVFDFSYGWTQVLNERLQGVISMGLTADEAISPVLDDDVAFDLALKRPGDQTISTYTVLLKAADTAGFTHIQQLADYISGRIALVANGALQTRDHLPTWVNGSTETEGDVSVAGAGTVTVGQDGGEPVEAVLMLDIGSASGTLELGYAGKTETVAIGSADGNDAIAEKLRTSVATLVGADPAHIVITGSRGEGFRIAFSGALAGRAFNAAYQVEDLATTASDLKTVTVDIGLRSGTLTLGQGSQTRTVAIGETASAESLRSDLKAALAALTGRAASGITVTGNRTDGFVATFASALSEAVTAAMTVQDSRSFSAAMTLDAQATASVSTVAEAGTGTSEQKVLVIAGYDRGSFQLELLGKKTAPIRYIADPTVQAMMIQKALDNIAGAGNVTVSFPQKDPLDPTGQENNPGSAPRFVISFKNDLANRDIPNMTVFYGGLKEGSYVPAGETRRVELYELRKGDGAGQEVQTVTVTGDTGTPTSFKLSWTYGGKTYTTAPLQQTATAAQVRAALLDATSGGSRLGDIAGLDLAVTRPMSDTWRIVFGGSLDGQDVAQMQVVDLSGGSAPEIGLRLAQAGSVKSEVQEISLNASSGTYRLQIGADGALSDTLSAHATAAEVRAILEALPGVGEGNVTVTGGDGRWDISFVGALAGRDIETLIVSPVQEVSVAPDAGGATTDIQVRFSGDDGYGAAVDIAGMTDAEVRAALQDRIEALTGVGVGNVDVRKVDVPAGEPALWAITFLGDLAGKTVPALQIKVGTAEVTARAVVSSLIQVGTTETSQKDGKTWGKLTFAPTNVDDFEYFAIVPSAGVAVDLLEPSTADTAEVQRLIVVDGGGGDYVLSFTKDDVTATTGLLAHDADAATIQAAINTALSGAGIAGSVSVADADEDNVNRVANGWLAYDITFAGALATGNQPTFVPEFPALRAVEGVDGVVYALRDGRPERSGSVARDEVQRIVITNADGGTFGLAMRIGDDLYPIDGPIDLGATDAELADLLTEAGLDPAQIAGMDHAARMAKVIEAALTRALTRGTDPVPGAEVTVTAVPGAQDSWTWDVEFGGSLAATDLPTLALYGGGLNAADAGTSYASSIALGIRDGGQEAAIEYGPKFNTLADFASVLEEAVNELLPSGETFSVNARFDAAAMDFIFDLKLTPSLPALETAINLAGDIGDLAGMDASGVLSLVAGIDFETSIGIDFDRVQDFTVVGGQVAAGQFVGAAASGLSGFGGKILQDPGQPYDSGSNPAVDATFDINVDGGELYSVTVTADAQADNTSLDDLIADINAALAGTSTKSQLSSLGFATLGEAVSAQAVTVDGKTQIALMIQARGIATVDLAPDDKLKTVLGLDDEQTTIAGRQASLAETTTLAPSTFYVEIDGDADNRLQVDLAGGTYTRQELINALNAAFAATAVGSSPLAGKVGTLGDALQAVLIDAAGEPVLGFQTINGHITTLKLKASPSDPLVRTLGFVTDDVTRSQGVALFLQDTRLGGNLVAEAYDFQASADLGFLHLTMDDLVAAIQAGISVQLKNGSDGSPGDRIYISDLIDASTKHDSDLGSRSDVSLSAGGEKIFAAAPASADGVMTDDIGLTVTVTDPAVNGGAPIALQVVLLAADTTDNTGVQDLADDLNAAIHAALAAWAAEAGVSAPFAGHVFVGVGDLTDYDGAVTASNAVLTLKAPSSASLEVKGRRLISDYMTSIIYGDADYTEGSTPIATLSISGIDMDAGDLNLLPPDVDPAIDISVPLLELWRSGASLKDIMDVQITGADALLGFRDMSWVQVVDGLRMASNLLGQLEYFSFLNQDIPVIDLSVNDIFDIASDLAHAIDQMSANPAAGVSALRSVLADSFGLPIYDPAHPDVFGVDVNYDAASNAIAIVVPYQIPIADKDYSISMDLESLGRMIGGNVLQSLMGSVSSLVDVGGAAQVTLKSTALVNLSFGIDLSSGEMFVYDFNDNGTDSLDDDTGTFARLGINVAGQDLNFNAALGPVALKIVDGLAEILAQAGLYLNDEPGGGAGAGDGRHYLSSAVSVRNLRDGDPMALLWEAVTAAGFTVTGQTGGAPITIVPGTDDPDSTQDDTFRLTIEVGGKTFHTRALSRDYDAAGVQGAIAEAVLFGVDALKGDVVVEAVDDVDRTAGWKVTFSGAGFDGKTVRVTAHHLDYSVDGGVPLGAVNALQWVSVPSGSGGTFSLSVNYQGTTYKTAPIAWNADAATVAAAVQTALRNGPKGIAGAVVSGVLHDANRPQDGWDLEFSGTLAGTAITRMDADADGLTHVGAVSIVPLETGRAEGGGQVATDVRLAVVAGTSGTFDITFGDGTRTWTATGIAYDVTATELQAKLNAAMGGSYSGITVEDDADSGGFRISFGGSSLMGKAVTVTASTAALKASPFGSLIRDLDVNLDGTAKVLLPAYVELPSDIVSLARKAGLIDRDTRNPISVGDLEVYVTSLKDLVGNLATGQSLTSKQITASGSYDTDFDINYRLPDLGITYSALALKNPLIRLIRDPSIVIDGIDYALKGIQETLNAVASLPLPLIGDQLAKGAQFINDFRSSVIAEISEFLATTVDTYGGMENALRMALFNAFTADSNGDGLINPLSWTEWIAAEADGTPTASRDGDNPFLNFLQDYNMDGLITADDIVVEFLAMGLTGVANGTRLGYTLAGTRDDEKGDKVGGDIVDTVDGWSALNDAKALQLRMHLGQNLLARDVDLSFDIGLPGLNLDVDGGVHLDLGWDFFFGFGVNTTDGLYLVSEMPSHAGLDDSAYVPGTDVPENAVIANPWDLPDTGINAATKEISLSFDAYLIGNDDTTPAQMTANIFFLQGQLTDDWSSELIGPDGDTYNDLFKFGNEVVGARTWFHGGLSVDITDRNNDGRLTWGEMTKGKFSDNFKTEVNGKAQANFHMDLSIEGQRSFPRLIGDFHLTWSLKEIQGATGYESFFSPSPTVWITDLGIDVGSFFADFLGPIVETIQDVTGPLQQIIDPLMDPIPGLSELTGSKISLIDLAEQYGKGDKRIEFLVTFVKMIDLINAIPTDAEGLILPVGRVFRLTGDLKNPSGKTGSSLSGDVNDIDSAMDSPVADPKTGTTGGSTAGAKSFLGKLNDPKNAFKIPLLSDFSLILDLIMGKPVDLIVYAPPDLGLHTEIDVGSYVYPGVRVGVRGGFDLDIALTLGFDTSGIIRYAETHNVLDIFDGFYVSDNIVDGRDLPEIVAEAVLKVYGELNAAVIRAGVGGGIKITGTMDLWDEEGPGADDGKFRLKEIWAQITCNPLNVVEAHINGRAFMDVYVDIQTLIAGWKSVFNKELFGVDLFNLDHVPDPCMPILASDDDGDGTFVLHMGSPEDLDEVDGLYDGLITKGAADRKYRNTDDGDETFVIRQVDDDEIEITATLDGIEYTVAYEGVKRIVGFTGRGNDIVDASGLTSIDVILVGGDGNDTLIGGTGNDILVGGTGTSTLMGGDGDDLLVARGGTTLMNGEAGADSYRFLGDWGEATVADTDGDFNVFDFSAQTQGVAFDTANRTATQGDSRMAWQADTRLSLIAGGTGADTIDMSAETDRLHINVSNVSDAFATLGGGLHAAAGSRLTDTDSATSNDGVISGASTGEANSENTQGDHIFRFTGIENLVGGLNSDVFVFENLAAITGSLHGGPGRNAGANPGAERSYARNILDFSQYNSGVVVNESGAPVLLPDGFQMPDGSTGVGLYSRLTAEAQSVTIRGFHDIFGGRGDDVLVGDYRDNLILGMEGDDVLIGREGEDMLAADSIYLTDHDVTVRNTGTPSEPFPAWRYLPGREWTWNGAIVQNVAMDDLPGSQMLFGDQGNDFLFGSSGDDILHSGDGNDAMIGDFARLEIEADGTVWHAETDTGFADYAGGADTIVGLDGDHIVFGGQGGGGDTITLGIGNSVVFGDTGWVDMFSADRRPWQAETNGNGEGEGDIITVGVSDGPVAGGSNLIFGGAGDDVITVYDAETSTNIVLGDHGSVRYHAPEIVPWDVDGDGVVDSDFLARVAAQGDGNGGPLAEVVGDRDEVSGGDDTITMHDGNQVVVGGLGEDAITLRAEGALDTATRHVIGDHAVLTYDTTGHLTDLETTDTQVDTGGADTILIGTEGSTRDVGENLVAGGMKGDDIRVVETTTSEDMIFGDNGEIHRMAWTEADGNRMLEAVSIQTGKGGADTISVGNGGKVILGGFDDDVISAADGDHLVFGDNGRLSYDEAAQNGILRKMTSIDQVFGGDDQITLGEGFVVALGGFGDDVIDIQGTASAMARGVRDLTGLDGVAGVGATEAIGRTGRFVMGDNAEVSFDIYGGLYDILSTDVIAATGGIDTITLGKRDTTQDLGYQVVIGGMAGDTITVRDQSRSEDVLIGDNAHYQRKAQGYGIQLIESLSPERGGADVISTGRGVKTVIGGSDADTVTIATVAEAGKTDRVIALGDSGTLSYDLGGSGRLQQAVSMAYGVGANDTFTIGDGDIALIGGYGNDQVAVNSILAATRVIAGDNARMQFAGNGSPAELVALETLDIASSTGGDDSVRIGRNGDVTSDMGRAILVGGMGSDTLTVNGRRAQAGLIGDNVSLTLDLASGSITEMSSLLPELGDTDTLTVGNGVHLIVGGMGGDIITAGRGRSVVFGDSGSASFQASTDGGLLGLARAATSVGLARGGSDIIGLGSGDSDTDGDKVVIAGFGGDTVEVTALAGHERMIAGDNADIRFDSYGRMTTFQTLDVDASTGGNDTVMVSIDGETDADFLGDANIVAGGVRDDTLSVFAGGLTTDVMAGDNIDYRRVRGDDGVYRHLFAGSVTPNVGGKDSLRVGAGDKLLFGGAGDDSVVAQTGTDAGERVIAFGDNGTITFDPEGSGALRRAMTSAAAFGGSDTITVSSGAAYLFGGLGGDTLSAIGTGPERVFFGDHGQIDWAADGALASIASTDDGTNMTAPTEVDSFSLPAGNHNYIIGGPGVDQLLAAGLTPANDVALPGIGSIRNPGTETQVVNVVVLGEYGEFGETWAAYAKHPDGGDDDSGGSLSGHGAVAEGGTTTVSDKLSYPAYDGSASSFVEGTTQGTYGDLVVAANGNWTYTLSSERAAPLTAGEARQDVFLVQTTEGRVAVVTIDVTGAGSVIGGDTSGVVSEDGTTSAAGTLTVTFGVTAFQPVDLAGTYGAFSLNAAGAWTYVLANSAAIVQALRGGEVVQDRFTVALRDGTTQDLTIQIGGTADAPRLSVGTGDEDEATLGEDGKDLTAEGSLSMSDPDRGATLTAGVDGVAVSGDADGLPDAPDLLDFLTLETDPATGRLTWRFVGPAAAFAYLKGGQSVVLSYTARVMDDTGLTGTHAVTVTVEGSNTAPVVALRAGDSDSAAGAEDAGLVRARGTLSLIDEGDTAVSVDVTSVDAIANGGSAMRLPSSQALLEMLRLSGGLDVGQTNGRVHWAFDSGAGTFAYLVAGESVTVTYHLRATDGAGATTDHAVSIVIVGVDAAPRATGGIADRAARMEVGTPWAMALPNDLFTSDEPEDGVHLSVGLADGSTLPSWLHYDMARNRLVGTPPEGALALTLRVTATDDAGSATSVDFRLSLTVTPVAVPPSIASPVPTQPLPPIVAGSVLGGASSGSVVGDVAAGQPPGALFADAARDLAGGAILGGGQTLTQDRPVVSPMTLGQRLFSRSEASQPPALQAGVATSAGPAGVADRLLGSAVRTKDLPTGDDADDTPRPSVPVSVSTGTDRAAVPQGAAPAGEMSSEGVDGLGDADTVVGGGAAAPAAPASGGVPTDGVPVPEAAPGPDGAPGSAPAEPPTDAGSETGGAAAVGAGLGLGGLIGARGQTRILWDSVTPSQGDKGRNRSSRAA